MIQCMQSLAQIGDWTEPLTEREQEGGTSSIQLMSAFFWVVMAHIYEKRVTSASHVLSLWFLWPLFTK